MEVIKHGRVYYLKTFDKEIECRCGSILKINLDDLGMDHCQKSDMRGEIYTESHICVVCPECGKKIYLSNLSSEVIEYVRNKNLAQQKDG